MKKQCCRIRQRIWNNLYSVILRGCAKGVGCSDQTCMTSSHPVFGYSLNACSDVFLYHGLFQWFILLFWSIGYASAFCLKEKKPQFIFDFGFCCTYLALAGPHCIPERVYRWRIRNKLSCPVAHTQCSGSLFIAWQTQRFTHSSNKYFHNLIDLTVRCTL